MLDERAIPGQHEYLAAQLAEWPRSVPVLDLGCGSGAWLSRLQRAGFTDLTGVDMGPDPRLPGITFVPANLDSDVPALPRRFRLVTAIEVIEHLEDFGSLFRVISQTMTDDGATLITTPNIHSLHCRLKFMLTGLLASFDERGDPTHIAPMLLPCMEKVATRYGLRVERVWTYPERGTIIFQRVVRSLSAIARLAVPDPLPGDTLCLWIKKPTAHGNQD